MSNRQAGHTTKQMLEAPHGAVFIWCNGCTGYPHALAKHLGRTDLLILPPSSLTPERLCGRSLPVVMDHALSGSEAFYKARDYLRDRGLLVE